MIEFKRIIKVLYIIGSIISDCLSLANAKRLPYAQSSLLERNSNHQLALVLTYHVKSTLTYAAFDYLT